MSDQNNYDNYRYFFARVQNVREAEPATVQAYMERAVKDPEFIRTNPNAAQELKRRNPEMYRRIRDGLPATLPSQKQAPASQPVPAQTSADWHDKFMADIDKAIEQAKKVL